MLFRVIAAAGLAVALSLPSAAFAETSLTAYEAARQALLAIWTELPLTARNATLTDGPAKPGHDDPVSGCRLGGAEVVA